MFPQVSLSTVEREDVQRVSDWLSDREVNSFWYGLGDDGQPIHIGYSPQQLLRASAAEWRQVFGNEDRKIYSLHSPESQHIGEGQLVIEWSRQEAQLFILIGRKDLWHLHYGTSALVQLLDEVFTTLELHRVWVDVPEYNEHALQMFRHLGFVLEGHLRRTHRKDNEWYDSFAMGLLADEYARRRARLLATGPGPTL
ncbi:MAG TPA: GNAT family protein [Dehalococcoidia bacterium]|nr:GNAT family protein [Dehalococcoidia bacterium]